MARIRARQALTSGGWQYNVTIEIGPDGRILSMGPADGRADLTVGCLLPAPANAHSHAFQRAMSGLTEARGPGGQDSFWTWRKLMFAFLERLTPDQVQAIAAFVQMEMLEAGYGRVAEFHYLHHQPDGVAYDDISEMSQRIAAAASDTGIGLTLLPVLYRFGGCDGRPLGPGQNRFGCDPDSYARLCEGAARTVADGPADWVFGTAPHSLRAVAPGDLAEVAALARGGPVHMHLAEQMAEVEEVTEHRGARPVTWLLDNADIGPGWHLVHCTQMTGAETAALARSGATAVLCPITESNLGDGIFDGTGWQAARGRLAFGSDSNLRIALAEEMRTFEYSQRLRDRARAVICTPETSTGRTIYDAACRGGAAASGCETGAIAPGRVADLLALDTDHPDLAGLSGDRVIDAWVFSGDDRMVGEVWSAGRHVVRDGAHVARPQITAAYRDAVSSLRGAA